MRGRRGVSMNLGGEAHSWALAPCGKPVIALRAFFRRLLLGGSYAPPNAPASFAVRFWSKVHKTRDCWLWLASTSSDGYGKIGRPGGKALVAAHRASWELAYGPIPEGLCVLHHCDNPVCVRPGHLFLGSRADNNRDMKRKGRTRGFRVLSWPQVCEARALAASGMPQAQLAKRFGICQHGISLLVRGATYRYP